MNRKPKTFRQTIVRAIVRPFIYVGIMAVSYFLSATLVGATFAVPAPRVEQPTAPWLNQPTKAERLMERFDCWNGEAPADMQGVIPGHVIITEAGRTYRAGSVKVGTALEVIFDGAKSEIEEIHGFCR